MSRRNAPSDADAALSERHAAAVARFRADLAAVLGRAVAADDRLGIAVSGGPDSMALLALAHAGWPGQVIAATVDHGLRSDAADEAAMVASWCAGQGIPHATLKREGGIARRAAVQAQARDLRYDLLARWALEAGAAALLTAHHADDQAETFLMRAARGAGLSGLSGIRPSRPVAVRDRHTGYPLGGVVAAYDEYRLQLVRPLLGWRRDDLRAFAVAQALPFVDDPSNADDRFKRTRFRVLLRDTDWIDPLQIARAAAYVGEGNDALEALIGWLWRERRVVPPGREAGSDYQTWLDLRDLPREAVRRLAREAIESVRTVNGITRPDFSPAANIEPLLDAVIGGKAATQAGVMVSRSGEIWHFREAPARKTG